VNVAITGARPAEGDVFALARRLTGMARLSEPANIEPLAGGKNNRVFRVDPVNGGPPLVLKCYFNDPRDPRDRRSAEWRFLEHAWAAGLRNIPEPLATEAPTHSALYSFVDGNKLVPGDVTGAHVDAALDFISAINEPRRVPVVFPPASEACFSLSQHLVTIERRLARLTDLEPAVPMRDEAQAFVSRQLGPGWASVKERIGKAGLDLDIEIGATSQCLSPSDFGFHNALVDNLGRVGFIDFEYAGRDDPAKLVSDFFCQPEIPVPASLHGRFVAKLAERLGLDNAFELRCRLLLDAYRIKWACIILNDFLPLGAARRAFADIGDWEQRCARQLGKAAHCLAQVGTSGHPAPCQEE
jgi:hypothetical protein